MHSLRGITTGEVEGGAVRILEGIGLGRDLEGRAVGRLVGSTLGVLEERRVGDAVERTVGLTDG